MGGRRAFFSAEGGGLRRGSGYAVMSFASKTTSGSSPPIGSRCFGGLPQARTSIRGAKNRIVFRTSAMDGAVVKDRDFHGFQEGADRLRECAVTQVTRFCAI